MECSVLGRFPGRYRQLLFGGGGEPQLIGSANMMHRNLSTRVEALYGVHRARIAELCIVA